MIRGEVEEASSGWLNYCTVEKGDKSFPFSPGGSHLVLGSFEGLWGSFPSFPPSAWLVSGTLVRTLSMCNGHNVDPYFLVLDPQGGVPDK